MNFGIQVWDLAGLVIEPVLRHLKLAGPAAVELVLGTALAENYRDRPVSLDQDGGPALGLWQMEPATFDDIHINFLQYRSPLDDAVSEIAGSWPADARALCGNLYLSAAMCRIHYLRVAAALPAAGDTRAQAGYWKKHYNTHKGGGAASHYVEAWRAIMED